MIEPIQLSLPSLTGTSDTLSTPSKPPIVGREGESESTMRQTWPGVALKLVTIQGVCPQPFIASLEIELKTKSLEPGELSSLGVG